MIYRSNLQCPDLSEYFLLRKPAMQIAGHDIPSDPDYAPDCGFLSADEAAILYHCVRAIGGGHWLDIDARFGWTAAHICEAGGTVTMVDPELQFQVKTARMESNMDHWWHRV